MNRPEFDEFAALWQDEPDPLEEARMQVYARKARRRGRLLGYLDFAFAALLLGMTFVFWFVSSSPLTTLIGLPLMLVIVWLTWKRRQVSQMTRTLNASTPQAFLQSSLRNARANLRRNAIGLVALPFAVPVALAFKVSTRTGGGPQEVWEAFLLWTQTLRAPITIFVLIAIAAFTWRTRRRIKSEINRLENLSRGYEAEAEAESSVHSG